MPDAPGQAAPPAARVLVAMGGVPLYGQERGNIQVFHALRDWGVDALFVTHKEHGHEHVQPELDRLGLRWTTGTYPGFWTIPSTTRAWARQVREFVAGNVDFVRAARAYQPTHVHMMNERLFLNLLPAVWALRLPVVFRVGDLPRQHRRAYRQAWSRLLVPSTTAFVCISEFVRRHVVAAGAPTERTRVVRNVPIERGAGASDLPDDLRAEAHGEAACPPGATVVYVGQLTEDKGVDLLVEAALALCAERDDVRFLIAGDYAWRNPFAQGLMADVDRAGLAHRVRFLGFLQDVDGLLALGDVHCAPSVWEEPLGNVVQEAKRAGVPSVVFPSGGLSELVLEPGRDGVVSRDRTAEALRDGLVHYLDMAPDKREAAGAAARSSLDALGLTASAFAEAWARVFAETLGWAPAAGPPVQRAFP